MLKVMITGCCGYIGSKLTALMLNHGHQVIGVDNFLYRQKHILGEFLGDPNFTFIHSDIRDTENFIEVANGCNVVMWLAALVGAPLCDKKIPDDVWSINYHAVKDFIEGLHVGVRVIYPNTNSGYGLGGEELCTEESPLLPLSLYAQSKCEAEKVVLDHDNSVSLRLATVFGVSPRMRFDLLVNDLVWQAYRYKELDLFEPHFRRNFVGINDVCRGFSWMISPHFKGVYNLGLEEANTNKLGLAQKICQYTPCKITTNSDKQDKDKRDYLVSNAKIKATGFKFKHTLERGIVEVLQYSSVLTEDEVKRMGNI